MSAHRPGARLLCPAGLALTMAALLAVTVLTLLPGAHAQARPVKNPDELAQALEQGSQLINITQSMIFLPKYLPLKPKGRVSIVVCSSTLCSGSATFKTTALDSRNDFIGLGWCFFLQYLCNLDFCGCLDLKYSNTSALSHRR
jgi:hypothetical protein